MNTLLAVCLLLAVVASLCMWDYLYWRKDAKARKKLEAELLANAQAARDAFERQAMEPPGVLPKIRKIRPSVADRARRKRKI